MSRSDHTDRAKALKITTINERQEEHKPSSWKIITNKNNWTAKKRTLGTAKVQFKKNKQIKVKLFWPFCSASIVSVSCFRVRRTCCNTPRPKSRRAWSRFTTPLSPETSPRKASAWGESTPSPAEVRTTKPSHGGQTSSRWKKTPAGRPRSSSKWGAAQAPSPELKSLFRITRRGLGGDECSEIQSQGSVRTVSNCKYQRLTTASRVEYAWNAPF